MKKILFLLLCTVSMYGQVSTGQEQEFDYGIKNNSAQTVTTPTYLGTVGADGTYGKILLADLQGTKGFLSTGLLKNGIISINADPTKFNTTAGIGIKSNFDDPENPTSRIITFPAFTGITPTYLLTGNITYVAIEEIGTSGVGQIFMQATQFTPVQRRDLIILGAVIHSNLTTINVVNNISAPTNADTNQLHDFIEAVGALNLTGNKYSSNGANMQLNKSAGTIFKFGVNFANDWKNPHQIAQPAATALTFRYRTQDGTEGSDRVNLDPSLYDLNNVYTAVPNNKFVIETVVTFQTGMTRILKGQAYYDDLATAKAAIFTRSFVVEPNSKENGIIRGYIIMRNNTTSLQTVADADILEAQKFGGVASGGIALTLANIVSALGYTPENVANKATDFTTVNNTLYPTIQAVKTYADNLVVGLLDDRGTYNAGSNIFPSTGGSGTSGAILKGDIWYVGTAGTLGGQSVSIGDSFRALVDAPGQTLANWSIMDGNINYVPANDTNVIHKTGSETKTGALIVTPVVTSDPAIIGNSETSDGVTGTSSTGRGVVASSSTGIGLEVINGLGNTSDLARFSTNSLSMTKIDYQGNITATSSTLSGNINSANSMINNTVGTNRQLSFQTSGVNRWIVRATSAAESGANVGSNFEILARTDAGGVLATSLLINRATSAITLAGTVTASPATVSTELPTWGQTTVSPALTGTPTAPTATAGTNTTQIATTAFVATVDAGNVKLTGDQNIFDKKRHIDVFGLSAYDIILDGNILSYSPAVGSVMLGKNASSNFAFKSYLTSAASFSLSSLTANREYTMPDQAGTIALTNNPTPITATLLDTSGYTVATLPSPPSTGAGTFAYVTDALAPTYMATVVGGGAVVQPVFYNGTNWVAH